MRAGEPQPHPNNPHRGSSSSHRLAIYGRLVLLCQCTLQAAEGEDVSDSEGREEPQVRWLQVTEASDLRLVLATAHLKLVECDNKVESGREGSYSGEAPPCGSNSLLKIEMGVAFAESAGSRSASSEEEESESESLDEGTTTKSVLRGRARRHGRHRDRTEIESNHGINRNPASIMSRGLSDESYV